MQLSENPMLVTSKLIPWNKGKLIGAKPRRPSFRIDQTCFGRSDVSVRGNVFHFESNHIATAQLAVDGEIE